MQAKSYKVLQLKMNLFIYVFQNVFEKYKQDCGKTKRTYYIKKNNSIKNFLEKVKKQ